MTDLLREVSDRHLPAGPLTLPPSVAKSEVEPSRKNEVIAHRARNGIADVTIAERTLPSQPRIDFCRQTYIEGEAIFAEVAQFGINNQRFVDRGVFSDLVAEQITNSERGKVTADSRRVSFLCVVGASE
jgi:hypothetical protein